MKHALKRLLGLKPLSDRKTQLNSTQLAVEMRRVVSQSYDVKGLATQLNSTAWFTTELVGFRPKWRILNMFRIS
jgi:hypothetical protein